MRNVLCQTLAVAWMCTTGSGLVAAQPAGPDATTPAGTHGKAAKPRRAAKPAANLAPAATNLNAPSTDFSNVEPDTGEPRERRQRGPNVRPGIDSNGRPVMGLGF